MKQLALAAAALAAAFIAPATASAHHAPGHDTWQLRKGAVVATDFGERLSRKELREGLRERGVYVAGKPTFAGGRFRARIYDANGDRYFVKIHQDTGEVLWFAGANRVKFF
ncbi:MAG: hypothetical protein AAFX03_06970 [Pseudomonadota bacterium]